VITKLLDQMFWGRYASNLNSGARGPTSACVAGMFQVFIGLYCTLIGLLSVVARIALILVQPHSAGDQRVTYTPSILMPVICGVAFAAATAFVVARYWQYRRTPERAASHSDGDLAETFALSLGYSAGSVVLMLLLIRLAS
jgi:hypothetical protein